MDWIKMFHLLGRNFNDDNDMHTPEKRNGWHVKMDAKGDSEHLETIIFSNVSLPDWIMQHAIS